jgi:hypothetical protein
MTVNFPIYAQGIISKQFLEFGLNDFNSAAVYIQNLPYKRNFNKSNLLCVLEELGGTCSTKHALLKNLAIENNFSQIKLMLGIFRMNAINTSTIFQVLKNYHLKEMPEAHNYLRYQNQILDYTKSNASSADFIIDLVQEIEIDPDQSMDFKTKYHQEFLQKYLKENPQIPYSLAKFWEIREECIFALQQ